MSSVTINCPSCHAKLAVPREAVKRFIRCGRCKHKFPFASVKQKVVEDVIASWLTEETLEEEEGMAPSEESVGEKSLLLHPEEDEGLLDSAPAPPGEIRCVAVERRGALLEFPAERLRSAEFRCGFPRQCMSCDSRTHLHAHVVIFASQLRLSMSMEAEHDAGALVIGDAETRGLSDMEILKLLKRVPNVPSPADLPMPYWVCDMCSAAGVVSGQIQVNRSTGKGRCRLFIRNIRRALQFMADVGGEDSEGYDQLKDRVDRTARRPWHSLPQVIRHRLEQWYQPEKGEQFVTYIPDRDHARTEDGISGLVISDVRLIYHTPRDHRQVRKDEHLELSHATGGGKRSVNIHAPSWEIKHFSVDRDGLAKMRRALALQKFKAVWL